MMEFILKHWGDLSSATGVLVSIIGLTWAVITARGARKSAVAAQQASDETRSAIGRHLLIIDLERSINLIQQLKSLHRDGRWDVALEQYQALRAMLSVISGRCPKDEAELRETLSNATVSVSAMELEVDSWVVYQLQEVDAVRLNQELNDIQSSLEELTSVMGLGV